MASSTVTQKYDYKFLDEPPEDLKCMICLDVAREPLQHEACGKLFCEECLLKHGRSKPCPNCREKSHYYTDKKSKRNIDDLRVKCNNYKRKCKWKGTVGTLDDHVATCQYTLIPCPNKCQTGKGETKKLMRKDLEHHLENDCPERDYECVYCGLESTYANITESHDDMCDKKIVPCPNPECIEDMERRYVTKHVDKKCKYTEIECKYKFIGCCEIMIRKKIKQHETDSKAHLQMAIQTTLELKKEAALRKQLFYGNQGINFKVPEFQKAKETNEFWSPSFYTHQGGYRMKIEVNANGYDEHEGTHISVYAYVRTGDYDKDLEWPLIGNATITLLNQIEDKNHHTMELKFKLKQHVCTYAGLDDFISHAALDFDPLQNTCYLKDNALYFKVVVNTESTRPWLQCTPL